MCSRKMSQRSPVPKRPIITNNNCLEHSQSQCGEPKDQSDGDEGKMYDCHERLQFVSVTAVKSVCRFAL